MGDPRCFMLSTIKGRPVLTSHHGGTPGGSSWARPSSPSANMAANRGMARALQMCPSYPSREEASPSLSSVIELEMGEANPSLGEGGHGVRHESKQAK